MITPPALAYAALIVTDVESAAAVFQRDFGLRRTDCTVGEGTRRVPVLSAGGSALALFPPGDPFVESDRWTRLLKQRRA